MALLNSRITALLKNGIKTKGNMEELLEISRNAGVDPRGITNMLRSHGAPIDWFGGSTNKLKVPLHEHEILVEASDNPLTEAKKVSFDELTGGFWHPAVGDVTRAGVRVTDVNGTKLSEPVDLGGGGRFGQAEKNIEQDSVWASKLGVITRIQNNINELAEKYPGVRQFMPHVSMSGTSGDFSTMNADVLMGLIEANGLSKAAAAAIDDMMQGGVAALNAKKRKGPPLKWDSIRDKGARGLLRKAPALRKLLMEGLSPAKMQAIETMPDIGAVRHATTDPDLLLTPSMTTGLSVWEVFPGKATVRTPKTPHPSYDTHLQGKHLGELETLLPERVAWPKFDEEFGGMRRDQREYTFGRKMMPQPLDGPWREGVEAHLKKGRS